MFIFIAIVIFLILWKLPVKFTFRLNCDPTGGIATAAIMVVAGSAQAYSQVKQGQAQKRYYDAMADNSRLQGEAQLAIAHKKSEIAQDIGSQEVKAEAIKGAEAQGYQKAIEAANGVQGSGTAQDIAIDSMRKVSENEINLKYNADTKSWSFDTEGEYAKWTANEQAKQYNVAGKQALGAAKRQAAITMLSTAVSVGTFGAMGGFAGAASGAGGAASIGTSGVSGASRLGIMGGSAMLI